VIEGGYGNLDAITNVSMAGLKDNTSLKKGDIKRVIKAAENYKQKN